MIRRWHSGATPLLIAVIVFLATALVAAAVIWKLESHRLEAERERVASLAGDQAEALQRNLERTLSATYALAAMVRQGGGEFPAFEEVARQMLRYFPAADSLQLAPAGVTRHIVPLAGNEAGLGRDLLRDPLRNKEALLARDSKQLTLAGPFELIQGGIGVIGRFPVFLEDAGDERFWGFATVVIRFPKIVEQIGLTKLSERGFAYQLWRVHPDTGERQIIAASSAAPQGESVEHIVNVPNGIWTLSLSPVAGWADPVGLAFKTAIGLLFSLLLAWLAKLLAASKVHEAELETLVAERTAEIRDGEQRLRQIEDNLPESYLYQYVHTADGTPRFLYVSAGVERVHGVTVEAALHDGRALHRQIDPEQLPALMEAEAASLRKMRDFAMELRMQRADGVSRWLQLRSSPRRRGDGQVVWDGVATDVTEHIKVVVALRENEERMRIFIEHAPAALAMFDRGMRYLAVSRRWLADYGLTGEILLGRCHYDIFPEIGEDWKAVHRCALAGEVVRSAEDSFKRANGSVLWLRWEVHPWHAADGRVGGIVIFSEDITERHRAEQERLELIGQLEKRNAELERFTYTVSHDLKSPLVTILGFTGQLEQDLRDQATESIDVDLAFIRGAAGQMGELLDSLLHLSRAGRSLGELQPVDLAELALKASEQLGARLAHTSLEIDIPADLPVVWGDPLRLREVMQNLLGNAAKFTSETVTPRIEIGCRAGSGEILCFVRDNGIGVSAEYQERIFGLFEQLDPGKEGTGIGLAIVSRIIEEHGGRVWVESAGAGQGSTFYFTLPN